MSTDLQRRLREFADAVPTAPGDLGEVERRARRRTRHQRAAAATGLGVAVLVAVTILGQLLVRPRPPVIEGGAGTQLELSLCHQEWCQQEPPPVDEVVARLRDDPAVTEVEVVDVATQRQQAAARSGQSVDEVPADVFAPVFVAVVRSDTEDLLTVARRLQAAIPGAGAVRRGPRREATAVTGWDPDARTGPAHEVASLDVGGQTLAARMWPVADGGRCIAVGELVRCGADVLLDQQSAGEAWGRPADGVTCAWAAVGHGVEEFVVDFADGSRVDGQLGAAPSGLLAGAAVACTDTHTHPVELSYEHDGGQGSRRGMAPHTEVRPPGVPDWDAVADEVTAGLPDDRIADLREVGDAAARQQALATLVDGLDPAGVEDVQVYDTAVGVYRPGEDVRSTQVAAEVTTVQGDPICMVVLLYPPDHPYPSSLVRPTIWTPAGCPPLGAADQGSTQGDA